MLRTRLREKCRTDLYVHDCVNGPVTFLSHSLFSSPLSLVSLHRSFSLSLTSCFLPLFRQRSKVLLENKRAVSRYVRLRARAPFRHVLRGNAAYARTFSLTFTVVVMNNRCRTIVFIICTVHLAVTQSLELLSRATW